MREYRSMGEAVAQSMQRNIDLAVEAGVWDRRDCCCTLRVTGHAEDCEGYRA